MKTFAQLSNAALLSMPKNSAYWGGFLRGLRRSFFCGDFGTRTEHDLWLLSSEHLDPNRAERGRGYIEGYEEGNRNQ